MLRAASKFYQAFRDWCSGAGRKLLIRSQIIYEHNSELTSLGPASIFWTFIQ
jgi:hypothetical protein